MAKRKVKIYEDYFLDMTDEERKTRKKMNNAVKSVKDDCIVELFKIDGEKQELTILKEPYKENVIVKMHQYELMEIMDKYNYFKIDVKDKVALYGMDLFNESMKTYQLRREFLKDFNKYIMEV